MTDHTAALTALRAEITDRWTVDIHGEYLCDNRDGARIEPQPDGTLVLRPRKPWASQGRKFPTMTLTFEDGKDYEVSGHTVTLYHTFTALTSRSRPGDRRAVRTFTFHPPRD